MLLGYRKTPYVVAVLIPLALAAGCRRSKSRSSASTSAMALNTAIQAGIDGAVASNDSAHPPIDCPLHKLGVDPMHLRPFDDVEKYIAFLEKPERAVWQKPDDVVAALGLKGSETLVDVGAGSGYFTFRFAKALPQGMVIAADTEPEMIRHIHHKVMSDGIKNIRAVLIRPEDPQVGKDADWVFICDVLHHVPERSKWLATVASEMKPGAHLALIEFKEGRLPEGPPEGAKIPRTQLSSLATGAGLKPEGEKENILSYQVFLIFKKP